MPDHADQSPSLIRVCIRAGRDDWIGVAYANESADPSKIHEYVPKTEVDAVWEKAIAIAYQVYRHLDETEADFLEGKFTQNLTDSERVALVSFHDQQCGARYVITALEAARDRGKQDG